MTHRLRRWTCAAVSLLIALPAQAQDIGTILDLTGPNGMSLGQWNMDGDRAAPSDLYIRPDVSANGVPVPHRGPYVFTRQTPETGAHAVFALVFSDAPVACAEEVGTFPLDTSLAAFMTATDAEALYAYGNSIAETGQDPAQLTSDPLGPNQVSFVTLPNGANFPAAAVQYEGDFPLYGFYDGAGGLVALAGLFGIEDRNGPNVPSAALPQVEPVKKGRVFPRTQICSGLGSVPICFSRTDTDLAGGMRPPCRLWIF